MAFQLGQTVGGYEFLDIIRSSRSTISYKVRNIAENRFEILRIVSSDPAGDQEQVERFLRESKIHARMEHPNILAFYWAGELGGHMVMTTEYIEGVTLAERLEIGPMAWQEAAGYATQMLDALACTHSFGVVHREISAGTAFVTPGRVLKITGFSRARVLDDPRLTLTGAVIGPIHYMSPEQVRGETDLDSRSDIYSAGVVLYELVTGRRPFESRIQFDVMLAHVNTPPRPPIELVPGIPPSLNDIVLQALAKDPAARFSSAGGFHDALAGLVSGVAAASGSRPPSPSGLDPIPAHVRETLHAPVETQFPPPEPPAFARRAAEPASAFLAGDWQRESDAKLLYLLLGVLAIIAFVAVLSNRPS